MENQTQTKVYLHYNHTDACKFSRWTARESYQFMYARPWQKVVDFYSNLVKGKISLSGVFGTETRFINDDADILEASEESEWVSFPTSKTTGRWARATFKIVLSYNGVSFDGWQKRPGLNTVQGFVEKCLGKFIDEKKFGLLKDKGLSIEGCAVVAGHTDKGVTAFQQVCSFYTWRKDVKAQDIEEAINDTAPEKLRVISVSEVSCAFHPNFSAKWRHYLYIFPFNGGDEQSSRGTGKKPSRFSVNKVNQLLCQVEGKLLSYRMFARDTKASRNFGPPTECFVFHA